MRIFRRLSGFLLKDKIRNKCIYEKLEVASMKGKMREKSLRDGLDFRHVQCRLMNTLVKGSNMIAVAGGSQPRGRPKQP